MKVLYFSGTGNSLNVAKTLTENIYSISEMIRENRYEFSDDEVGIVFPVYCWNIPKIVKKFLEKMKIDRSMFLSSQQWPVMIMQQH